MVIIAPPISLSIPILKSSKEEILQPFQYLATCTGEKLFSISNNNSKDHLALVAAAVCAVTGLLHKEPGSVFSVLLFQLAFGTSSRTFSLPSFLTAEHTQVSQSALTSMSCSSIAVLVALHCICSSMSMPFLSWVLPKRQLRYRLRDTE